MLIIMLYEGNNLFQPWKEAQDQHDLSHDYIQNFEMNEHPTFSKNEKNIGVHQTTLTLVDCIKRIGSYFWILKTNTACYGGIINKDRRIR